LRFMPVALTPTSVLEFDGCTGACVLLPPLSCVSAGSHPPGHSSDGYDSPKWFRCGPKYRWSTCWITRRQPEVGGAPLAEVRRVCRNVSVAVSGAVVGVTFDGVPSSRSHLRQTARDALCRNVMASLYNATNRAWRSACCAAWAMRFAAANRNASPTAAIEADSHGCVSCI